MWLWGGGDNVRCGMVANVAKCGGEVWIAHATSMGILHQTFLQDAAIKYFDIFDHNNDFGEF